MPKAFTKLEVPFYLDSHTACFVAFDAPACERTHETWSGFLGMCVASEESP